MVEVTRLRLPYQFSEYRQKRQTIDRSDNPQFESLALLEFRQG